MIFFKKYEIAERNTVGTRHTPPPPRWVDCDAAEFEEVWLPKFESGKLPPCSDEEWQKINSILHSDEREDN